MSQLLVCPRGTIGKGMIWLDIVTQYVVIAGLLGAIIWDLLTWGRYTVIEVGTVFIASAEFVVSSIYSLGERYSGMVCSSNGTLVRDAQKIVRSEWELEIYV